MNQTIVIYHGGCRDGFCAAWVYNKYATKKYNENQKKVLDNTIDITPNVEYHPGYHGQESPDVKGKNVVILDFCYPLEVMQRILEQCNKLIWLDHHKTADKVANWFFETLNKKLPFYEKLDFEFDNNKSGAGLTWDYFMVTEPRPWLVDYVEDRDLWLKKLPGTDETNAFIACLEFDFSKWDDANSYTWDKLMSLGWGKIAEMKTEQYVREVCKNVYFANIVKRTEAGNLIKTYGRNIPIVNICQVDCSEVLHALCEKYPDSQFSMYWFKRADGMYQYGLRSIGDFDVSVVAKLFGGGGHKNAAGFQLNYLLEELK